MFALGLLLVALVLGGLGVWLLLRARSDQEATGLPVGRVTYVDTGAWNRCERPLFSSRYRLTGKPDYLVRAARAPMDAKMPTRSSRALIPVEVKSSAAPEQPYPAHVLQLAAYCLLVEEQEGRTPPYGILRYRDRAFEVDYTPELRAQLLQSLDAMRHDLRAADVERSHDEPARCRGCGLRRHCDGRLD